MQYIFNVIVVIVCYVVILEWEGRFHYNAMILTATETKPVETICHIIKKKIVES